MRKVGILSLFLFFFLSLSIAQNRTAELLASDLPEIYLSLSSINKTTLQDLQKKYSVDKAVYNEETACYDIVLWLHQQDYASFLELGIPFEIQQGNQAKYTPELANSYEEFVSEFDLYPTYQGYLAIMNKFESSYPDLCEIVTILDSTTNGHKIIAAHLRRDVKGFLNKPSFFYSSTIHGDEPVGYYLLLRLINYILVYQHDPIAAKILDEVDLWICPLENPDGTYYSGDSLLGTNPVSLRSNAKGIDLNRHYPHWGSTISGNYQDEIEAMIRFTKNKKFVMSASLHGGAEVFNYPWDMFTSSQKSHPDAAWWNYVGRKFADSCHTKSPSFFTDMNNGVTPGGDWYVISGSRQDFMNYYRNCREVTLEIASNKVLKNNQLPLYWDYLKSSLLNYVLEATYGFSGTVCDEVTGQPVEATVFIHNHDDDAQKSKIYSSPQTGRYFRPVYAGEYQVTFLANGYIPQTHTVLVKNEEATELNVHLSRHRYPEKEKLIFFPNPVCAFLTLTTQDVEWAYFSYRLCDLNGKILFTGKANGMTAEVNMLHYPAGIYFVEIINEKSEIRRGKVLKMH